MVLLFGRQYMYMYRYSHSRTEENSKAHLRSDDRDKIIQMCEGKQKKGRQGKGKGKARREKNFMIFFLINPLQLESYPISFLPYIPFPFRCVRATSWNSIQYVYMYKNNRGRKKS
jgi:hypothetical protein